MKRSAILYSLPVFFLAIMVGPAGSIVQGIYTREYGLPLASIAGLIVICRLLDALTDPVIGILSDRTRHWRGGRKIWVVVGSAIVLAAVYFLFIPPVGYITPVYFFLAYLFTFVGWTIVEVSHLSWGAELASGYDERSSLFSYRMGAFFAGTFVFLSLPLLIGLWQSWQGGGPLSIGASEYSGATLKVAFWLIAALFPVAVFLAIRYCPQPRAEGPPARLSIMSAVQSLRWNRPMALFSVVLVLFFLGNGMQVAMAYLHLASYLQLGPKAALIYVICFPLNLLTIPLWLGLTRRFGKSTILAVGVALSATLFVLLGLIRPGPAAFLQYLSVFAALQCAQAAWQVLPPAILGDISDYATLKTGTEQTGTYYAMYAFLYKAVSGFGAAIGFGVAGWFGFNPALDVHTRASAFGIVMVMAFIPAGLGFLAAGVALIIPINRSRHFIIQRALERRARRLTGANATG